MNGPNSAHNKIWLELSVEYAIKFYVAEWYRTTLEDLEMMKDRMKKARDAADTEKEKRKQERKYSNLELRKQKKSTVAFNWKF